MAIDAAIRGEVVEDRGRACRDGFTINFMQVIGLGPCGILGPEGDKADESLAVADHAYRNVDDLGNDWVDWLSARIALDEAAALIKTPEGNGNKKQ